jgi:hypothetical protein
MNLVNQPVPGGGTPPGTGGPAAGASLSSPRQDEANAASPSAATRADQEFPAEPGGRAVSDVLGDRASEQYAVRDKRSVLETAKAAADDVKWLFSPTARGAARDMEYVVRGRAAMLAQSGDRTRDALEAFRHIVGRLTQAQKYDFTDRAETGRGQVAPDLQPVADAIRGQYDYWKGRIQSLGPDMLREARDFYMGRIWANHTEWAAGMAPVAAAEAQARGLGNATAAGLAKSPLLGNQNFRKQRNFDTMKEGMDALNANGVGLIPVTDNPIEMATLKLREMQRFYHGKMMEREIKQTGMARWVPEQDEVRARQLGMVKLNDKVFQPLTRETGHGVTSHGNWYAPEALATIFNNYMSEGLHGNFVPYDMMRKFNNGLNQLQLGLSGFHATFIALDSMTSRVALGLQQALGHGDIGRGLVNVALGFSPHTVATTLARGSKTRAAFLDPAGATPEMRKTVDMLIAGGMRISQDQFYRSTDAGSFIKNMSDITNPGTAFREAAQMVRDTPLTSPFRIAARLLETVTEPLMGQMVPRAKLGVAADLVTDWLRRNPNATPKETSAAATKIVDSVDNRMGQMVYDNLFWHKTLKDIAFVMTRSVGWNLGTIRELGGAGVDTARQVGAMARGNAPELTTRMAYAMAMPAIAAVFGAMLTYAYTGKGPQETLDYFYPPSGKTVDGVKQRMQIPGYIKDVIAYSHAPLQTLANKTSPGISMAQQLANNKDYYGGGIYLPEKGDNMAHAYAEYLINQALPFSIRAQQKLSGQHVSMLDQSLAFWGIQPAPASIVNPDRAAKWRQRQDNAEYRAREREPDRLRLP